MFSVRDYIMPKIKDSAFGFVAARQGRKQCKSAAQGSTPKTRKHKPRADEPKWDQCQSIQQFRRTRRRVSCPSSNDKVSFFPYLPLFFVPPERNNVYGCKNTRFFLIPKEVKAYFFDEKVCNELLQHIDYQLCCFQKVCITHFKHKIDDF